MCWRGARLCWGNWLLQIFHDKSLNILYSRWQCRRWECRRGTRMFWGNWVQTSRRRASRGMTRMWFVMPGPKSLLLQKSVKIIEYTMLTHSDVDRCDWMTMPLALDVLDHEGGVRCWHHDELERDHDSDACQWVYVNTDINDKLLNILYSHIRMCTSVSSRRCWIYCLNLRVWVASLRVGMGRRRCRQPGHLNRPGRDLVKNTFKIRRSRKSHNLNWFDDNSSENQ